MNRINSLVLCFFLLGLAGGHNPARAQGNGPEDSQEGRAATTSAITFSHLYIARTISTPIPWWQTSTHVDASGGVHMAFYTSQFIHYAYCPAACDNLINWSETPLVAAGSYDALDYPTLALDAGNHPRMMWYIHPDYYYAECNANCTNAASWTPVKVPVAAKYYIDPQSARYFSLDSHGKPRFVCSGENDDYEHTYTSFTYTTCEGNCTIASNWHSYFIDLGQNMYVYQPQIVLNANNQPRIMAILDVNSVYNLVYYKCDANCSQGGSWTYNVLYEVGQDGEFSFRLDSQGWPRVAYYKESISDPMLYYAWSTTAAANPASWVITHLNLPPNDWRTVDLAIDSKDRPRMAFASADQNLEYVECTANCGDPTGAVWQVQDIETVDALNAIDPISPGTCSSSTWMVEGFPSLALDGADRPSVSYFVRHYKACPATTHDVWGLRFATAGTGPEPKSLGKRVFLPAIVR